MRYYAFILLLLSSFSGLFAQLPDYSATFNITWPKDPGCYSGSHRGRPIVLNNTLCAENGSRLRGDHIYMLPTWSQCWSHNLDSNTWKDMRDKRYLNCVRLLLYEPPLKAEGDGALTISDAVRYSKVIDSIATHFGFYVIIDYQSGGGYDSTRVKNFFRAMCAEFADSENVIFQTQSEPVWADYIPSAYTDVEKDFTVSIWKQIRTWAPKSPIILWEFANIKPGTPTFKDVVDSRPAIDYSNTIVGWHGYHLGYDSSLVGNGLKRYYPTMMTEMTRCPPNYGTGDYRDDIAKLEAMGCSWITLGAFPFADPHDAIKETIVSQSGRTNLLNNSDFDAGTSAWTFYTNGVGSMQLVTPGYSGGQAVNLTITQSGTNTQLYQYNIPVEANTAYRLSFAAYSKTGNGLDVAFQQHGSPYINYGLNKHIALSTAWTLYTVEFSSTVSTAASDGRLMFWLGSNAVSGDQYWIDNVVLEKTVSTASAPLGETPAGYSLEQNYPNPFNPSTTIKYTVGGAGSQGPGAGEAGTGNSGLGTSRTRLVVYDLLGRQVAVLVDEFKAPGSYQVTFSAKGGSPPDRRRAGASGGDGSGLASGMYIYRLTAGPLVQSRTMVFVK